MRVTKFQWLLGAAIFCPAVVMADTAPTSVFQLNGFAGSQNQVGSDGLFDPTVSATCTYSTGTNPQFCDNWNLLNGAGTTANPGVAGHSGIRIFVNAAGATQVFRVGSKDINDVSTWMWSPGSSPGKDTFNGVYAAAYIGPTDNHLVLIFGADRATNNGDANIGAWLFQRAVTANADGTFSCGGTTPCHVDGDVFVTSQFTGGGGSSFVDVFEWNASMCSTAKVVKAPYTQSEVLTCVGPNLELLAAESTTTGICGSTLVCGITNTATTHTSWEGGIPSPQFFEGGVDITALFLSANPGASPPCFSTFELETRSSADDSAELKDFVIHGFPVCSAAVSKTCTATASPVSPFVHYINNVPYINYSFSGTVTNDGIGTIFDPTVTDSFPAMAINLALTSALTNTGGCNGTTTTCTALKMVVSGGLTHGQSATYTGSFDFPTEGTITNNVTATASASEGGLQTISKDTNGNPTAGSANFGDTGTACHIATHPSLQLTKFCNILLAPTSSGVVLQQVDNIQVCNQSTDVTQIKNISISNTVSNGPASVSIASGVVLNAGQCTTYTPTAYTPTNCVNAKINPTLGADGNPLTSPPDAGRCTFQDVASISSIPTDEFGTALSSTQFSGPQTATCNLCLFGYCTASTVAH